MRKPANMLLPLLALAPLALAQSSTSSATTPSTIASSNPAASPPPSSITPSASTTHSYPTATLLLQGSITTGFEAALIHASGCYTTFGLQCVDDDLCSTYTVSAPLTLLHPPSPLYSH